MSRQNHTTIKLTREEVLGLLDALESQHLFCLDEEELATRDRLMKRLDRALDRV